LDIEGNQCASQSLSDEQIADVVACEETIMGWFHGQSLVDVFRDLGGWLQIAATTFLLWLVLVSYLGSFGLPKS
jgi:hypothetical protein